MARLLDRFQVPIPIRALQTANVYLIDSGGEFILVDTGMNAESFSYIRKSLGSRPPARIILTHLHIDHIGGAMLLKKEFGSEIIMGYEDWKRVEAIQGDPEGFLNWMRNFMADEGVPPSVLDRIVQGHSVLDHIRDYAELEIDRSIRETRERIGDITIIKNPGHSPGSISVSLDDGIIFTGDHVLDRITPNISFYDSTYDSLGNYLLSIKKSMELPVKIAYPGHGPEINSFRERCDQIYNHHIQRVQEIANIARKPMTAFQIAEQMRWSKGRTLNSMNFTEMNFAIGEAIAHIRYMINAGSMRSLFRDGIKYYVSDPSAAPVIDPKSA
ncbi:MAG: MBL fold metallo-hydrolase [Thermoplasmataceae archaeon]